MAWRPTWPELLSLFEEPRFQVAVVSLVLAVGAVAVAITLPRPGGFSSTSSPPVREQARVENAGTVAGAEPAAIATDATSEAPTTAPTVVQTEASRTATVTATEVIAPVVRPSTPAVRAARFEVGDRTQLVAPAPIRLSCTEDQPPLGVLLSGRSVEVIEVGASTCESWILVQSDEGLTWLRPSVLEPLETVAGTEGASAP
ncbi:MAG: hypothetical protein R3C39_01320 [Dehalococcoidia bacterium]